MGDLLPLREPATAVDVATLLARLTAARAGYLDNINNANLATIADISSLTAIEIAHIDADISSRSSHNAAAIWAVATRNLTAQAFPFTNPGAALDVSNIRTAAYGQYNTEMARITADVATEAKQDVIDGFHDVPGEDSATDTQMRDVVGKKSDTVAGTSIVAISKQVKAKTDNIPASPAPSGEYDTELAKLAGEAIDEDTTTKNWNTAVDSPDGEGGIVCTVGSAATKKKVHALLLDVSALTNTAVIHVKLFMKINGVQQKVYDTDFTIATDPDGLWIINDTLGIHDVLTVAVYSDTDESKAIGYTAMTEAM